MDRRAFMAGIVSITVAPALPKLAPLSNVFQGFVSGGPSMMLGVNGHALVYDMGVNNIIFDATPARLEAAQRHYGDVLEYFRSHGMTVLEWSA